MGFFSKIKEKLGTGSGSAMFEEAEHGYVELSKESEMEARSKLTVRPFVIKRLADPLGLTVTLTELGLCL